MASIQQLNDLKKSIEKQIDKLIASLPPVADAAGDDVEPEKMTPRQKLDKQLEEANDKLIKLNEYLVGAPLNKVDRRRVQVANYINALKRGGQLSPNLEVVR